MLLSSVVGHTPAVISGFGAAATGSDPLKKLQTALVALSTATRNPTINPGTVSGQLTNGLPDDRTMGAIAASFALINPHLPTWAAAGLSIGFGLGASTDYAKSLVIQYASELTKAVNAATIAAPYYTPAESPTSSTNLPTFQASGAWYTTWWGIGAIAVGLLGGLSLVAAHRRDAAV